jgi:hypothetical protein
LTQAPKRVLRNDFYNPPGRPIDQYRLVVESLFGKISDVDSPVGSFEMLSRIEGHGFEVRPHQLEVIGRKAR